MHYTEIFSLTQLAKRFFINSGYLSDRFFKKTDTTFAHCQNKLRIGAAKKLLRDGCDVEKAANKVGFDNPKYFARVFQQFEGCSPSEFQRESGVR